MALALHPAEPTIDDRAVLTTIDEMDASGRRCSPDTLEAALRRRLGSCDAAQVDRCLLRLLDAGLVERDPQASFHLSDLGICRTPPSAGVLDALHPPEIRRRLRLTDRSWRSDGAADATIIAAHARYLQALVDRPPTS